MGANNMKAMREALEKIAHYCDSPDHMDDPYCADGHILSDIAKEAVAAPPRNCDRFESYSDAWRDFKKYRYGYSDAVSLDKFCNWLFAEAKGAGDGCEH